MSTDIPATQDEDAGVRNRVNTRARLVRAGRRLFLEGDFQSVSVDKVARAAGFTRAAFYLHFASKDDLVAAIMLDEWHRPMPAFQWFEDHPRDAASIEGFIRHFIAQSRQLRGRDFHIAALQSAVARDAFREIRDRLIDVLGRGFPAFRPRRDDSADELARAARARGIVVQLEQLSVREYDMAGAPLADAIIQDIATQMLALDAAWPE